LKQIEDSLKHSSDNELAELKKSLKIEFVGEDGVDAGGLRKEWFLLLVRHLFDPKYGKCNAFESELFYKIRFPILICYLYFKVCLPGMRILNYVGLILQVWKQVISTI
jgi:hypothetical protein